MNDRLAALNRLAAFSQTVDAALDAALAQRFGRTRSEVMTLLSVRHCADFTVGWLAGVLQLTHSAAVRLADRLQALGLLTRTAVADRRQVGLALTANGRALADRMLASRKAALQALFAGIDDASLAAALPLFDTVLRRASGDEMAAYRSCRLCDEAMCGASCPVEKGLAGTA